MGKISPALLKSACLTAAGSPKQAFYNIWIEQDSQAYLVCKASGAGGRIWHQQEWEFNTLAAAEALFLKWLRHKTNSARRSEREYRPGRLLPAIG